MSCNVRCLCGTVLETADETAAVRETLEHVSVVHPDLGLTEVQVANYVHAALRLDTSPVALRRRGAVGKVVVRPAAPSDAEAIVSFLERDAFPDNPAWATCYCLAPHVEGADDDDWSQRTWERNRAERVERTTAGRGTPVLAFVDGALAGWVNAGPIDDVPAAESVESGTGFIACFVVAPPYRRHGLAARLLTGALDALTAAGFDTVEASAVVDPPNAAVAFPGPLALYEAVGFTVVSDDGHRARVRRSLR
jgi:ribosomal protein S18 acetylase RimI-like enzyme